MLPPQGEARAAPGRAGAGERKWGAPEGARRGVVNAEPCICSPRPGTSESQAEELTTEHDAGHTFRGVTAVALGAARPASRPCAAPVGPPFGAGDSFQPAQADAGAAFPLWGSCDAPVLCPPSQPLPSAPRTPPRTVPRAPSLLVLVCRAAPPPRKSSLCTGTGGAAS